jgi:hypothetical protein
MSVEKILAERPSQHGEFEENARATWRIMEALQAERNWATLGAGQKHALYMIAHKMGRILAGDPNFPDHWEDIEGYAECVVNRIKKPVKPFDAQEQMKQDILERNRAAEGRGSAAPSPLSSVVPSRHSVAAAGTPEDGGQHATEDKKFLPPRV